MYFFLPTNICAIPRKYGWEKEKNWLVIRHRIWNDKREDFGQYVCVSEKERKLYSGSEIQKFGYFFCFGMKKSLCNKIFCCYSHKNMYEIYLTSFSSLYKDNRNVSLVINLMWKVVLHTVSHVRVYFPNAWIIFFTVHTDPYFLRLLQSLFCCLAFYT